jgi:hypothetical protein
MLKNILGFIFVLSAATLWIYLLYSLADPDVSFLSFFQHMSGTGSDTDTDHKSNCIEY